MADVSQQPGVEQVQTNGLTDAEDDERGKARPADIDADMREMERRKRVEMIMGSRLFREELERILDGQLREGGAGGASGLLQRLGEMMGVSAGRVPAGAFKSANCVLPINDIRGVESMGYGKGEKILRCKLAAAFRLMDMYGWTHGIDSQITARLNADQELFLVNPYGMLYHEVTASSLVKANMQGTVLEQGTTNFGINLPGFLLHSAVHAARPDVRCVIHVACPSVLAVSALRAGLLPVSRDAALVGDVATHQYIGGLPDSEERDRLSRSLGPVSKVLILSNHGAVCCGETVEEAFYTATHVVAACEAQLRLMPAGIENLALIPEETRKLIYETSRRAPDNSQQHQSQQVTTNTTTEPDGTVITTTSTTTTTVQDQVKEARAQACRWRVGGPEFEALMRMLDNAGYRTGYIYRQPLVKGEPPRPKNEVEVPPAVSSLGYLMEEEEMYRQGIWKKLDGRKGHDRTRWLNSPNVYQKVEILETGTPDPKKITKWVADGSPTHSSTPVKIDAALQFVPKNTNPKEFKQIQQQIKDYRRADKISAGPQSQILEGATWDEARRLQDAGESHAGDHVVLLGAASKGIIQRGFQHNATMYKAPYAKNPFDAVTDDEINEYKKTVERKAKGDYDTDFSESEALSSLHITTTTHSGADKLDHSGTAKAPSGTTRHHHHTATASETEEESRDEPRILRIETRHAPKPSQPEVVLSDVNADFLSVERSNASRLVKKEEGNNSPAHSSVSQTKNLVLIQHQHQPGSVLIEKRLVQEQQPVFVQTATRVVRKSGENTVNGDHSDAHPSTFSQSSKEEMSTEDSPKKDKKKKKGLRTPSFLKKKKEKKKSIEA